MNQQRYCAILDELKIDIAEKGRHDLSGFHNMNSLHDNAKPHVARSTVAKLHEINLLTLPHAPYSPDKAPSDFYLFSSLKSFFVDKTFTPKRMLNKL